MSLVVYIWGYLNSFKTLAVRQKDTRTMIKILETHKIELNEFYVNLIRESNTINIMQKENSIKTSTELRILAKESGVKNTPIF